MKIRTACFLCALFATIGADGVAQTANISEETRMLATYPFSEPNPVPILVRDPRLYPYHTFEGYATEPMQQEWKVVRLENDFIEVFVLPEVGGKVWGAVVKETGHEFIYRNEVMKFRNIALRGPWTSGGIEFNFGVIGHTPATATPVDYVLQENDDGSVSCIVGAMDLPSRTQWRVEVRLPAERAYYETNVLWYNPTELEHPYYNWMTAAAFAQYDLEMAMPGDAYLTHPGEARSWPIDQAGRYLPSYANNTFEGHKSYHVVGELNDFFGGYYTDDDYGFGHWARYEEMPGQKLWLWALSREGGVWEELLTDTDGQYVEFQAGRLLVQYSPDGHINPITQASFDPGATDRWSETWFPLEGIGGLTDASRDGAMYVAREGNRLTVSINAFGNLSDTLELWVDEQLTESVPIDFSALEPVDREFSVPADAGCRLELPVLKLSYYSESGERDLARPFQADPGARQQIPTADVNAFEARELLKARLYKDARVLFEAALSEEPWHRDALLGMADLEYRRGSYEAGLSYTNKALQLDAYDASANFSAGNLYRALGRDTDAREAYGWAARSMAYRSVAYLQLAELALVRHQVEDAERYARSAMDYDAYSVSARELLAIVGRATGDETLAESMRVEISEFDPLSHFPQIERFLSSHRTGATDLFSQLHSEYPDQSVLELASGYARRGLEADAARLLGAAGEVFTNPLIGAWRAFLTEDPSLLESGAQVAFAFPFRLETLPVLEWAKAQSDHWSWSYLLALNLWALGREGEAADRFVALGDEPDFAPFYVSRAALLADLRQKDRERDLRRAVELDGAERTLRIYLIQYLQEMGRWEDALVESATGRSMFPGDFNLDLLHVRSLNNLDRANEAIQVLESTHVLPSENARESHRLYEQAHLLAAMNSIDEGNRNQAQRHLAAAREWPEHLGQGRPYEPDERNILMLYGRLAAISGDRAAATEAYEAVARSVETGAALVSRADLLVIPALVALGRQSELAALDFDIGSETGEFASKLIRAAGSGGDIGQAITRLAVEHEGLFGDLDGNLLLRTLQDSDWGGEGR